MFIMAYSSTIRMTFPVNPSARAADLPQAVPQDSDFHYPRNLNHDANGGGRAGRRVPVSSR